MTRAMNKQRMRAPSRPVISRCREQPECLRRKRAGPIAYAGAGRTRRLLPHCQFRQWAQHRSHCHLIIVATLRRPE
jgi:hypothetical protein